MSQEAHHERQKQMTRQRKKLGWKDEREGAEIKAEKKNGKGRWALRRRTVTFLLMEHNKPSSLYFPPVGVECQSISCPINMSEEAKQTNKQTKMSASESTHGSLCAGWLCGEKCTADHCGSVVCHFPPSATVRPWCYSGHVPSNGLLLRFRSSLDIFLSF